jgi:hypothetical protein
MKRLESSKTLSFILPSYTGKFVRTGVPDKDNSSFIHCLLHASYNDYTLKDTENKLKMVQTVRDKIAKNISKNEWEYFGSEWRKLFEKNVIKVFDNVYEKLCPSRYNKSPPLKKSKSASSIVEKIMKNEEIVKYIGIYKVLFSEINFTHFMNIINKCIDSSSSKSIEDCKDTITLQSLLLISKILRAVDIDEGRREAFSEKFSLLIRTILNETEMDIIYKLKQQVKDENTELSLQLAHIIADKFDRDVYFIDSSTMMPYTPTDWKNKGNRQFIILLVIDNTYEIVGRVIDDTNRVQRNFKADDPIIDKFFERKKKSYHRAKSLEKREHSSRSSSSSSSSSSSTYSSTSSTSSSSSSASTSSSSSSN